MLREVCGEYLTRTGKVGATIYRTTSGGQVTYSYIGTWGAGSGLSAADMRATVKEWGRTKRGARAAVPFGDRRRRRAYGHSAPELVLRNEVTGAHHGQVDGRVIAYLGDRPVGSLMWSEFRGETLIQMIRVSPELARRGVATKMYRALKADTKGRIKWGMLTPEGRALYRTLKARREL